MDDVYCLIEKAVVLRHFVSQEEQTISECCLIVIQKAVEHMFFTRPITDVLAVDSLQPRFLHTETCEYASELFSSSANGSSCPCCSVLLPPHCLMIPYHALHTWSRLGFWESCLAHVRGRSFFCGPWKRTAFGRNSPNV